MKIFPITGPRGRATFPVSGFEPVLLLAAVIAYEIGFLSGRSFPVCGRTVLVLLAPLFVIHRLPHRWRADRLVTLACLAMFATIAWSLVQLTWATPMVEIGAGRCAVMAAALMLCWAVIHGPAPAEGLIVSIGVSATLAMAVAIVGMVAFDFPSYGLGNINHLLYCCTPAYYGWAAWLVASAWLGRRAPTWQWLICGAATVELMYMSLVAVPGMPRRGVIIAGLLVLSCAAAMRLWTRSRRAFAIAALAVLALGGWSAWKAVHRPEGEAMARSERVLMYRAALEAIPQVLPWGAGLHGPLKEQDMDGETLRHQTATGLWMSDAHNQLLEAFLDGGFVGGLLFIALVVVIAWRTIRITDPALRVGAMAIGVVLLLHALTDNCYGMPGGIVWAGVLLGTMLTCPAAVPAIRPAGIPGLRIIGWALVAFCSYASTREMSGMFMSTEASDSVRLRTLRQTWQVDVLGDQWRPGVERAYTHGNMPVCRAYLDIVGPRMWWTGGLLSTRCLVDSRTSEIALNQFWDGLVGVWRQPLQVAAFSRDWRTLAAATSADVDQARALAQWTRRLPMGNFGYENLRTLLARRPDLSEMVPESVKARMDYRSGRPGLPEPLFERPTSVETAADLYARMVWADLRGYGPERLSEPLRWLLRKYGDIGEVYLLAMMLARDAEPGAYAWLVDEPAIKRGFEPIFVIDYLALLKSVQEPKQARAMLPAMRCVNPRLMGSFDTGTRHDHAASEGTWHSVWEESLRIWTLARPLKSSR